MGRRVEAAEPIMEADKAELDRRFQQLGLRLRLSAAEGSELRAEICRGCDAAEKLATPHNRLDALLDLADRIRPRLPEGVQRWTLSEDFNRWRKS